MILLLSMLSMLSSGVAHAESTPYPYRVTLLGGPAGLAGPPSLGGGVEGRAWLAGERGAIEVGARELYTSEDERMVGAIFAGARVAIGELPLYWRLGFAHNHETPMNLVLESPVGAVAGTLEGIRHRSGAEVGLAWSRLVTPALLDGSALGDRLGVNADLGFAAFPDDKGPHFYVYGGAQLTVGLGERVQGL